MECEAKKMMLKYTLKKCFWSSWNLTIFFKMVENLTEVLNLNVYPLSDFLNWFKMTRPL